MSEINDKEELLNEEQPISNETENTPKEAVDAAETKTTDNFEQKYKDTYDQFVRLFAEFDNYKKRVAKERMELAKTAGSEIVSAILPAIDDFNRAAKFFENSTDIQSLKEGVDLIHKKLWKALADKGLEEVSPVAGDAFDADIHEAVTQIPAPDESLKGKIIDTAEKGFSLNGKIIRYPKVIVGA
jgi:molecular chaperone GrpE